MFEFTGLESSREEKEDIPTSEEGNSKSTLPVLNFHKGRMTSCVIVCGSENLEDG